MVKPIGYVGRWDGIGETLRQAVSTWFEGRPKDIRTFAKTVSSTTLCMNDQLNTNSECLEPVSEFGSMPITSFMMAALCRSGSF